MRTRTINWYSFKLCKLEKKNSTIWQCQIPPLCAAELQLHVCLLLYQCTWLVCQLLIPATRKHTSMCFYRFGDPANSVHIFHSGPTCLKVKNILNKGNGYNTSAVILASTISLQQWVMTFSTQKKPNKRKYHQFRKYVNIPNKKNAV